MKREIIKMHGRTVMQGKVLLSVWGLGHTEGKGGEGCHRPDVFSAEIGLHNHLGFRPKLFAAQSHPVTSGLVETSLPEWLVVMRSVLSYLPHCELRSC